VQNIPANNNIENIEVQAMSIGTLHFYALIPKNHNNKHIDEFTPTIGTIKYEEC
jgi:hypothetical protein